MSVNPVSVKTNNYKKNQSTPPQKPAFRGGPQDVIIYLMDFANSSYAATFLSQDTLGMIAPRTGAALYRNKDKTGEYNYKYATMVAIRECLSGPSIFAIPLIMLKAIKSQCGRANNVPTSFIKGFSDEFAEFVKQNPEILSRKSEEITEAYYEHAVRNLVVQSTKGQLPKEEEDKAVKELTRLLLDSEKLPKKGLFSKKTDANGEKIRYSQSAEGEFGERFAEIKKRWAENSHGKTFQAFFSVPKEFNGAGQVEDQPGKFFIETEISRFKAHLQDFTHDITKSLPKGLTPEQAQEFIEKFANKKVGSRFITNLAMSAAVMIFFTTIPRIYNSVTKENPQLAGLGCNMQPEKLPPILDHVEEGK